MPVNASMLGTQYTTCGKVYNIRVALLQHRDIIFIVYILWLESEIDCQLLEQLADGPLEQHHLEIFAIGILLCKTVAEKSSR